MCHRNALDIIKESEMPWDEKEFDRQVEKNRVLEQIIAKPAVKGINGPFEPEMIVAGAQWSVGEPQQLRAQADIIAQKACDEFNAGVRSMVTDLISETGYKKAKA